MGGGVFWSKLWSSQIWSFPKWGGGGYSGLQFQKGVFWKIWTKIYCSARNLLVHRSSLSHSTYVETNKYSGTPSWRISTQVLNLGDVWRYIIAHFLIFIKHDRFATYICSNYTFIYIPHWSDEVNAFTNHNWLWKFLRSQCYLTLMLSDGWNRSEIRIFILPANGAYKLVLNLFWSSPSFETYSNGTSFRWTISH